ncbi:MAG: hypothetical protein ACOCP4_04600, partial [Candidatus Woesearchaeota archaeon]
NFMKDDEKNNDISGWKIFAGVMTVGWIFNLVGVILKGEIDNKFIVGTIILIILWGIALFKFE